VAGVEGENEQLARNAWDALSRQDFDTWIAAIDENIVYVPTKEWFDATPRRGREPVLEFIKGFLEDWSRWELSIREIRGNADRVLVETRVNATGAKSGIELRGRTFHVMTFHDGLITHLQDFILEDEAVAAAGLAT
jgi:ketosteroid isomerase-like protein